MSNEQRLMEKREWIKNMSCFQAQCRGFLVRKALRSVQAEFEDIVKELEGSVEHLTWRGQFIPKPHFTDRESTSFRYRQPKIQTHPEDSEKLKDQPEEREKSLVHTVLLVAERYEEPNSSPQRDCSQACTPPGGDREGEGLETETGADLSSMALETSYSSFLQNGNQTHPLLKDVAHSPEALRQHRKTLAMELLWIQQAIASRKKYLTLKQKMEVA
ncbi:IQ domain-containing protein C [Pygocentrus nattereri]|uniref:IQ motif containing C n=1 Tax=Pygocentrus nattereri TaxID=42514 RepID=A0A3B4CBN1_PYGNA|nr:IQ domain-containing protein C [Pygocentrus nattereri]